MTGVVIVEGQRRLSQPERTKLPAKRLEAETAPEGMVAGLGDPVLGALLPSGQRARRNFSPSDLVVAFLGTRKPAGERLRRVAGRHGDGLDTACTDSREVEATLNGE